MPSKIAIFENIEMYSPEELVRYIKDGIVTFDELCEETDGGFSAQARKAVQKALHGNEESDWQAALAAPSVAAFEQYINAHPNGMHRSEAMTRLLLMQQMQGASQSMNEWEAVDKQSLQALRNFCEQHPQSPHCTEAKRFINQLRKEEFLGFSIEGLVARIKNIQADKTVLDPNQEIYNMLVDHLNRAKITHATLLSMIKGDPNLLRASVISQLLDEGYLDYDDFESIGIPAVFIRHLVNGETTQNFAPSRPLEQIEKLSTEVYFWGIPSSGKSCALGAILSVANNGRVARSMTKDNDCQGYGYMTRLAALFDNKDEVGTLPEGTSIYSTYEMGFDLEDQQGLVHPITCVDLAGELVRCMYKSDAGENMSNDEMEALDTLTRILIDNRTKNRKIHFFVLEYGADDRKYEGLTQTNYLDGALRYIERTGIFQKDTDAIYLIITKVDKADTTQSTLTEVLREYIGNTYAGFYNGLKSICKRCEINNGEVEIVPFSLGRVCFQDYCLFDPAPASGVVQKLLQHSKGFKQGKTQRFLNIFKQ